MLLSLYLKNSTPSKNMETTLKLYMTSVVTNREIAKKTQRIQHVLEAKGIKYETIDLSRDQDQRNMMREKAGIPDLLPPALFNGDTYCGDFQTFEDAVEAKKIEEFLGLK